METEALREKISQVFAGTSKTEQDTEVKNPLAKGYEGPAPQSREPKEDIKIPGNVDTNRPSAKPKVGLDEVDDSGIKNPILNPSQQTKSNDGKTNPTEGTQRDDDDGYGDK